MSVMEGFTGEWVNVSQVISNDYPPGLEYLTSINHLTVYPDRKRKGFHWTNDRYIIKNNKGDNVYYASEDYDFFNRYCCGGGRSFDINIFDKHSDEVIHVHRSSTAHCCWPSALTRIEVSSPPGTIIGTVEEDRTFFYPTYFVRNVNGETIFKLKGPFGAFECCGNLDFRIMSSNGSAKVGKISKQYLNFFNRSLYSRDCFGITFPMDLDVKVKALLIGASFLIDVIYYN